MNRVGSGPHAELVLLGGNVITVDPANRIATGVAVADGRILAVGSTEEIRRLVGPSTRVIELHGGAVLPGINDSHLHGAMLGGYWPNTWLAGMAAGTGLPQPRDLRSRADRRAAIERAWAVLLPLGITSYTEPGLGPGARGQHGGACDDQTLAAYQELAESAAMRLRVTVLLLFGELDGPGAFADLVSGLENHAPNRRTGPNRLNVRGVKVFADGIPPMRNAWLSRPYTSGEHGELLVPGADTSERVATLRAMLAHVHRAGWQVGVHATGDRAITEVVDALGSAMTTDPRPEPRHYVIHGDCVTDLTLVAMAELGIGLNAQPGIYTATGPMLADALGAERADRVAPLRAALDRDVPLCLSSDGPVIRPDWRLGVADAVCRRWSASGEIHGAAQRIAVSEALRAYTITPAWQDGAEHWKGSIEVGKVADLCVLGADPLALPPDRIPDIDIRMTILDGETVWSDD